MHSLVSNKHCKLAPNYKSATGEIQRMLRSLGAIHNLLVKTTISSKYISKLRY